MEERERLIRSYRKRLKQEITNPDVESAHSTADELLCDLLKELGYQKVVDIYNKVPTW